MKTTNTMCIQARFGTTNKKYNNRGRGSSASSKSSASTTSKTNCLSSSEGGMGNQTKNDQAEALISFDRDDSVITSPMKRSSPSLRSKCGTKVILKQSACTLSEPDESVCRPNVYTLGPDMSKFYFSSFKSPQFLKTEVEDTVTKEAENDEEPDPIRVFSLNREQTAYRNTMYQSTANKIGRQRRISLPTSLNIASASSTMNSLLSGSMEDLRTLGSGKTKQKPGVVWQYRQTKASKRTMPQSGRSNKKLKTSHANNVSLMYDFQVVMHRESLKNRNEIKVSVVETLFTFLPNTLHLPSALPTTSSGRA